jgi:beta-glucosidase
MKVTPISNEAKQAAKEIASQLSLEEKVLLRHGNGSWCTQPIERLQIRSLRLADGPHGLRKKADLDKPSSEENTVKATCFPPAVAASCSFDRELIYEMGCALGEECVSESVDILLGPAVNIKRSPLCGRNFEYVSEDPYVAAQYATALINGIQSKNVGACLKHFLANNQETARLVSNSIIDERALREIYLSAFEYAVKNAKPWSIMTSYNQINGEYASSHKQMIDELLRKEWGYDGHIMTDWGAMENRIKSADVGVDLEMPEPPNEFFEDITDAVKSGKLSMQKIDSSCERLLAIIQQTATNSPAPYNKLAHHDLARRIARESAVLLKNDSVLPASKSAKVALIGEFAKKPRFQGSGSSRIVPTFINSAHDEFSSQKINFLYSQGYNINNDEVDSALIEEAVKTAKECDIVFAFIGLTDEYESEGYDRKHMRLPHSHNALIEALVQTGKPVVVVLSCGSAVEIPWRNKVSAILLMNLAGQDCGGAAYDLLFGDYSPCGKLTETFPIALEDTPSYNYFGTLGNVEYRESVFVGYRYYNTARKEVAYPFGFGLSYSSFEYSSLRLSSQSINDNEDVKVTVTIRNTGNCYAKEIVQLYVAPPKSRIFKPIHELRAFEKVSLEPNEEKDVEFSLSKRDFAYYSTNIKDWHVESGDYTIQIAASSVDIRLEGVLHIQSTTNADIPDYRSVAPAYYSLNSAKTLSIPKKQFKAVYGSTIIEKPARPFTENSTIRDLFSDPNASILANELLNKANIVLDSIPDVRFREMLQGMVYDTPLRSTLFLPDSLTKQQIAEILSYANSDGNER